MDMDMCMCCKFIWLIIMFFYGTLIFMFGIGFNEPTFSIERFYVPALDNISNDTLNPFIFVDLQLINPNDQQTVHYSALNVSIFYGQQNKSSPILLPNVAVVSIPGFNQESSDIAHRLEMVTATGVDWETARQEVLNGTTVFQVDLQTKLRYEQFIWKTKRFSIMVGGDVKVNDQGSMVKTKKKGVKLTSGSIRHVVHFGYVAGSVGFVLLSLWS
ncbi:hypothetical protein AQUCO_05500138v1 [Aquilegia coerulea]|uniref:Late embryogenesis abundant protein LEA-2 subgroup domain-containing protein n=1 Tax=Aquilegia coerulea TaxID=218851 RepID=A0A2G5CH68_AQUCA|nr:hypothetical protein AQUCO_05500138v1 [Aquilegia coerulea]